MLKNKKQFFTFLNFIVSLRRGRVVEMRKGPLTCQVWWYADGKRVASIKFILKSSPSKFRSQSFVDFGVTSGAYKSLSSIIRHLNSYLHNSKTTKSTVKRLKYVLWG